MSKGTGACITIKGGTNDLKNRGAVSNINCESRVHMVTIVQLQSAAHSAAVQEI